MIVVWGKRRGDVTYNSRDYWRGHLPVKSLAEVVLLNTAYFDVGDIASLAGGLFKIVGIQGSVVALGQATNREALACRST